MDVTKALIIALCFFIVLNKIMKAFQEKLFLIQLAECNILNLRVDIGKVNLIY